MQVSDMITRVRFEIGEPSVAGQIGSQVGTWSDTQIIGYLNDAQGLLGRQARIQASPVTVNLVVGTYAYPIPSDCLEDGIRKLVWTTSGTTVLEVIDVGFDRWSELYADAYGTTETLPIVGPVYGIWAKQLFLFPNPQVIGDTLTIYYYQKPAALVNVTDISPMSDRFHIAMVKYAIGQCQFAVEETQLGQVAMNEFERLTLQLEQERSIESRDRPARVRLRS